MAVSIFDYSDYKVFTTDWIDAAPNHGRGLRAQIAEFIGCQVAYVSHVLANERHFSLEQAEALTRFMKLRDDEASTSRFSLSLLAQERYTFESLFLGSSRSANLITQI